jgi:hypothetical protein
MKTKKSKQKTHFLTFCIPIGELEHLFYSSAKCAISGTVENVLLGMQ